MQAADQAPGGAAVLPPMPPWPNASVRRCQVDRELRLHARLTHPNVIALYAAFEDDDHVYLVQVWGPGGGDGGKCAMAAQLHSGAIETLKPAVRETAMELAPDLTMTETASAVCSARHHVRHTPPPRHAQP